MDDEDRRIAYLAGESGAQIDSAERARLDDLRRLLADPAVWSEPDPSLEERVVRAVGWIADAHRPEQLPKR